MKEMIDNTHRTQRRWHFLAAAVLLLLSYGLAEGWWRGAGHDDDRLARAVRDMRVLPERIGNWKSQPLELDDRELAIGRIQGYSYRRYVQDGTGKVIRALLVCGEPGPVSAHAPEVCFTGAGYTQVGSIVKTTIREPLAESSAEFWTTVFRKQEAAIPDPLRVSWSWNAAGQWVAADYPRFRFARYPVLFKLYVVQQLETLGNPQGTDVSEQFIRLLLPQIQQEILSSN